MRNRPRARHWFLPAEVLIGSITLAQRSDPTRGFSTRVEYTRKIGMAIQAQREEKEQRPDQAVESTRDAAERFAWLPCRLSLEVPVSEFTLGDLLRLRRDSVVTTGLRSTEDIPLRVNSRLIAWIQFEMIGDRLAARITELA